MNKPNQTDLLHRNAGGGGDEPTRTHETVNAKFLRKLHEACGENATKTGKLLGLTGSTINSNLRDGTTRKTVELAAQFIYERQYAPASSKKVAAVIIAGEDTIRFIESLMQREGGEFTVLKGIKVE